MSYVGERMLIIAQQLLLVELVHLLSPATSVVTVVPLLSLFEATKG